MLSVNLKLEIRELIKGIKALSPTKRAKLIDEISRQPTISDLKCSLKITLVRLERKEMSKADTLTIISECNQLVRKLEAKANKLHKDEVTKGIFKFYLESTELKLA